MIAFPGREQSLDSQLGVAERLYIRLLGVPVCGLRIRLRRVLPVTGVGRYERILDAGCGNGVFSMELAKQHPQAEVVGIDVDEGLVARAQGIAERGGIDNCRFVLGDIADLSAVNEFDLVVSVDNLEHVEDDLSALRRLRRALKSKGRLVLHVPGMYRRWFIFGRRVNFDVPGHVRPGYTLEDLLHKLDAAGFEVETHQYTYGFLETLCNNVSYLISGADRRNKVLYAIVLPLLLAISYFGRRARPRWGAGVLVTASAGRADTESTA
jgi:SAM-dependent methyltransferase